jgi:hypothetical protein
MSHKNQEISILTITIKKCNVNNSSTSQRISRKERKNKEQGTPTDKDPQKHTQTSGMMNSTSLTPLQEPSTVACMIVTSLRQLHY